MYVALSLMKIERLLNEIEKTILRLSSFKRCEDYLQ